MAESQSVCRHCGGKIIPVTMAGVTVWVHPHAIPMNSSIGNQWCPVADARHRAEPVREEAEA